MRQFNSIEKRKAKTPFKTSEIYKIVLYFIKME